MTHRSASDVIVPSSPTRRVLIVVSAFNPAMVADMQRARMLSWELPKLGWEVEVLTPRAREVRQDVVEPQPAEFFPTDTRVHQVGSIAAGLFAALGSRSHSWRTLWTMRQRGDELIRSNRFDLVFFTTTTFIYFSLGPRWRRKFAIPYVIDFHDPWVRDDAVALRPRNWKRPLIERLSIHMERASVVDATGLVAVSPRYIETLRRRYGVWNPLWLARNRHAVIPFGALGTDLAEAAKTAKCDRQRSADELAIHYVGVGGAIMSRSFALICRALALLRAQGNPLIDRVRIRLFGTTYNWKPGDAKPLQLAAQEAGVGDLVTEIPERVSYRRSLELLLESDGALILGVDDSGYMPSKLFAYALSGRPLLASLRKDSPAFARFQDSPDLGNAVWFDQHGDMPLTDALAVVNKFLQQAANRQSFDRNEMLKPFLAPAMAGRHAELFNACLERGNS